MISLSLFWFVMLTPVWAAALHALIARTEAARPQPRQRIAFFSCVATVAFVTNSVLALEFFRYVGDGTLTMFAGVTSALLAHIYFHIFNMSETARRIRILLEIREGVTPHHSIYEQDSMVSVRIGRLKELGQIAVKGENYVGKKTLLATAARIIYWHEKLLFPRRFQNP